MSKRVRKDYFMTLIPQTQFANNNKTQDQNVNQFDFTDVIAQIGVFICEIVLIKPIENSLKPTADVN